ncbi:hypothetical protein J6590_055033 [Homalodisca vitripennis]|nr:hypothetical protein J6590_055033 [Homalodisca vitripennis]
MDQELVEALVSAVHTWDARITDFTKKKTLTASEFNPIFPKHQAVYVNEYLSPENKQLLGQLKRKCSEKMFFLGEGEEVVREKKGWGKIPQGKYN